MATAVPQRRAVNSVEIPDRLYFKIGDVAKLIGVETHVLRFWETQFPQLKPNKSGTGQRLYRRKEVELAVSIKELVHDKGYTIAGAKQALGEVVAEKRKAPKAAAIEAVPDPELAPTATLTAPYPHENTAQQKLDAVSGTMKNMRAELREIIDLLSHSEPQITVSQKA